MKLKFKNIITLLAVVVCVCLLFGTGYTVAKYTGVFDAGKFNLTLENGIEPLYTVVYHTFNGSTDVVLCTEDYYEEQEISMRGVPGTVSGDACNYTGLTFYGWSPQGVWTKDEDSPFNKDTSTTVNYVPDIRILYKAGDSVALSTLAEFSGKEIHLYDIYENHRVSLYRYIGSAILAENITFMVKDTYGNRLYDRVYWDTEGIAYRYNAPNDRTDVRCNGYAIAQNSYGTDGETKKYWYHYVHPGLTLYIFNNATGYAQGWGYYDTEILYDGKTANATTEETIIMPAGTCEFAIRTVKVADDDQSCFASGTLITMADGTKLPIEELTPGDLVRVYDHENGCYTASPILFIEYDGDKEWLVINLEFDDGTTQKFIGEHALFDRTLNKYVYITPENCKDFIGHRFAKEENVGYGEVVLTNAYTQVAFTGCYGMTTEYHMNFFVNGMFSIEGGITGLFNFFEYDENLAYDKELMAEDIEKYGLFTYEDFADYMTEKTFNTIFPVKYLKVSIGKGLTTFEGLEYIIERYIYRHGLDN